MLRSARRLSSFSLQGIDDDLGRVDDLYFDDSEWKARYFAVKTGGWLSGKRVILSPIAFTGVPEDNDVIHLNLTTEQISSSPDIDLPKPVSRQKEVDLHSHYGWAYYGYGGVGSMEKQPPYPCPDENRGEQSEDPHLRSMNEVTGYRVQATDEAVGHIEDFIVDDATWEVRFMVVDTAALWFGKKVLISAEHIAWVKWADEQVGLHLPRDGVKDMPEWDGHSPLEADQDETLTRPASYVI